MSRAAESQIVPADDGGLWPAFGLGLGLAIGNGFARFAYALLLPAMRADLGWNYVQAGWLNTANALGYVAGALSGYVLLRRLKAPGLFIAGLVLAVVSLAATGMGRDLGWLTAMRLLSGVGAAWVFSCGGPLIAMRYGRRPALLGPAAGLFFTGPGLGIAVAGLLVGPLLAAGGDRAWQQGWWALGAVSAVAALWPLGQARALHKAAGARVAPQPFGMAGLWACLGAYFCFAAGYIVYLTFIFAWMREAGLPWWAGTGVWTVLGLAVLASPFPWRRALSGWRASRTLAASCAIALLGSLLPLAGAGMPALVASALVYGLAAFIAPSAIGVLLHRALSVAQLGQGMALFTTVFAVGQAVGPLMGGWIADRYGLGASLWLGAVLLGAAALLALLPGQRD